MKAMQLKSGVVSKLAVAGALLALAFTAHAQVQTKTTTTPGNSTSTVTVERGQVVYVTGNNLVVKAEDGTLRHFDNVPENVTVTVDGKQLNVHQLKPGMTLERQTVVTNTPTRITTIKTVTGTVWHVSPPNSVILTLEDGKNQSFKIPKGTKFTVNGQETDSFGLRKGMIVSAQQVTETPEVVSTVDVTRTGTLPPPPPAPKADVPILVIFVPAKPARVLVAQNTAPAPAPASEPAPTKLPKTASNFPLIGLVGMLFIALGLGLRTIRTLKA